MSSRLFALGFALLVAGCPSLPATDPCLSPIPDGGCPAGRGGSCDDPTCDALYECVTAEWVVTQKCSRDGGAGGGGGQPTDAGAPDACTQVVIDHTGETTGCTSDLELPDCPAAAAETCVETVCLTGCLDFYLCEQVGWTEVAWCTDDGMFMLEQ